MPAIALLGVARLNLAFVFRPLRPLGNFAGAHDDPAEDAHGQEEDLAQGLEYCPAVHVKRQALPPMINGVGLSVSSTGPGPSSMYRRKNSK